MTPETILYLDFLEGNDNHLRKLAGIRRYASARGWEVETLPKNATSRDAVRALLAAGGIIGCIAEASGYRHSLPPRLFGGVPVVYLDPPEPLSWRGAVTVTCDNAAVAAAAYGELSAGMPPCFAAVPSGGAVLPWNRERIAAFRALCAANGRELRVFPARRREPRERRAARLLDWLAALPKRSALFATNDEVAREVVDAAGTIPRHVPKELSVIGVDGEPGTEDRGTFRAPGERPGLSSVKLDFEFAGHEAAQLLGRGVAASSFGPLCVLRRESTRGAGRRGPLVLEAVDAIRLEACEGLAAATLARRFDCSRRLFEIRFREAMGHSVLDEILHVRLTHAQALLMRREIPIRDIAGLCGFRTGIELRKLFRRRFKTSMRQWRNDHAPDN